MAGEVPIREQPPATDPPLVAGEREGLDAWLDFHREVLLRKCAGITLEELRTAACPPSNLTLLGLLRHMAEVERGWIRRVIEGTDAKSLWCTSDRPDADFDDVPTADPAEALAAWRAEVAHAREVLAGVSSLDQTFTRRERTYDGRWILVHLIEEYARHNGHADLLRQAIDGATGD